MSVFKPGQPFYDPKAVTADQMVLDVRRKMAKAQAEQIMALSKVYSKGAFPDGMLAEAAKVLQNK